MCEDEWVCFGLEWMMKESDNAHLFKEDTSHRFPIIVQLPNLVAQPVGRTAPTPRAQNKQNTTQYKSEDQVKPKKENAHGPEPVHEV